MANRRIAGAAVALLFFVACGAEHQPTLPTQPTPPMTTPPLTTQATSGIAGAEGFVGDSAGRALGDVDVSVVNGRHAGARTRTDAAGRFEFPQVTELATIRVGKDGYQEQSKSLYRVNSQPGRLYVWFRLESAVRPPISLNGTYSFTFSADPTCTTLPEIARTRTYSARIGGIYSWRLVALEGANFERTSGGYPGSTDWNVISLSLFEDFASLYFEDPSIRELVFDDTVEIYGHAEGAISASSSEFPVTGRFDFAGTSCISQNHRLVITNIGR